MLEYNDDREEYGVNLKLDYNFTGIGIDASKDYVLKGKNITHFYKLPDNLYRIQHSLKAASYDFIFSKDLIFYTKYHRILLKEWFYMLKKDGRMIIEFSPSKEKGTAFLSKEIKFLFRDKVKIVRKTTSKDLCKIEVIKIKQYEYENKPDDEWTFGIICNGKADKNVDSMIENINSLRVPKYEIIVCGTYNGKYQKEVKYIHFTEKDDKGWITKKKNIVAENAKFENLAIMHDRAFFEGDWFDQMRFWGNCWDQLNCPVRFKNDQIAGGWGTTKYPIDDIRSATVYNLDFSDWEEWAFCGGILTLIKKSVWKEIPWDNNRFWGQNEDVLLSHNISRAGYLVRNNPFATYYTNRGPDKEGFGLRIVKNIFCDGAIKGSTIKKLKTGGFQRYKNFLYKVYKVTGKKFREEYADNSFDKNQKLQKRK